MLQGCGLDVDEAAGGNTFTSDQILELEQGSEQMKKLNKKVPSLRPKSSQEDSDREGLTFLGKKYYRITYVIFGCINRGKICSKREGMGQLFGIAQTTISSRFRLHPVLQGKTEARLNKSGAGATI